MLLLLFRVADCRFAVEVTRVMEVVPRIPLRPVPHAPGYLAGMFDRGGEVVPVVDLGQLLNAVPCPPLLSTRIILVDYPLGGGRSARLGLIAEQVSELREAAGAPGAAPTREVPDAPYLGRVVDLGRELAQMIVVDRVLPEWLRDAVYGTMLGLS